MLNHVLKVMSCQRSAIGQMDMCLLFQMFPLPPESLRAGPWRRHLPSFHRLLVFCVCRKALVPEENCFSFVWVTSWDHLRWGDYFFQKKILCIISSGYNVLFIICKILFIWYILKKKKALIVICHLRFCYNYTFGFPRLYNGFSRRRKVIILLVMFYLPFFIYFLNVKHKVPREEKIRS